MRVFLKVHIDIDRSEHYHQAVIALLEDISDHTTCGGRRGQPASLG
jgi:hypothetical protein